MTDLRSLLFVPGDSELRFPKALGSGADAVIQDLEDAVPVDRKEEARRATAASLAGAGGRLRRFVRINARQTPFCWDDLHAVVVPGLDGIVLPKADDPGVVAAISWVLDELERSRGIDPGHVELIPLIESAAGVQAIPSLAGAVRRIRRLTFGAVDLSTELGLDCDAEESQLAHLRWQLVVASRAAGLHAPIDTVFLRIADSEGLAASVRRAKAIGFHGKLCIHPNQVDVVNRGFMPGEEEIAWARRILEKVGSDASVVAAASVEGTMVDRPVIERALKILRKGEGEGEKAGASPPR